MIMAFGITIRTAGFDSVTLFVLLTIAVTVHAGRHINLCIKWLYNPAIQAPDRVWSEI